MMTVEQADVQPERRRGDRRKRASTRWGPDDGDVAQPPAPGAAAAAEAVPAVDARPRKRPKRTRWGPDEPAAAGDAGDGAREVGCHTVALSAMLAVHVAS